MTTFSRGGLAATIGLLTVFTSSAGAATYHVRAGSGCSDSRTTTQAQSATTPWCTIAKAATATPSGADVVVHAGTYGATSLTRTMPITFRGAPGEARPSIGAFAIGAVSGLTLSGLGFTNGVTLTQSRSVNATDLDVRTKGIFAKGVVGLRVDASRFHDLTFTGNWNAVPDAAGYGVRVAPVVVTTTTLGIFRKTTTYRAGDVVVTGSTFENVQIDGVQAQATDGLTFRGNTVRNLVSTGGSHADAVQTTDVTRLEISGNDVRNSQRGFILDNSPGARVLDNVIFHVVEWGVDILNSTDVTIAGNSLWDTGQMAGGNQSALVFGSGAGGLTVVNNGMRRLNFTASQVTQEGWNFVAQPYPGVPYAATTLVGTSTSVRDPQLDPTTLEPLAGSPLIDAGTSDFGVPTTDIRGFARFDDPDVANSGSGATPYTDIGAVERQP